MPRPWLLTLVGDVRPPSLAQAIAAYSVALDRLPLNASAIQPERVLAVLLARDAVGNSFTGGDISPAQAQRLVALDKILSSRAPAILAAISPNTWEEWQQSLAGYPQAGWWWLGNQRSNSKQASPAWGIATGLCVLLSFSLIVDIALRFLSGGADFIAVFSSLVQVIAAILATSTLTATGQRALKRTFSALHISLNRQHYWQVGFAALLLCALAALRLAFPEVARYYNAQGLRLQTAGEITSAISSYQRSVNLQPDYAQAHYNLATAYEDVLLYNQAMPEYQKALRADPQMHLAYNNLARLYMLHGHDFTSALELLEDGLSHQGDLTPETRSRVSYAFLKNRGWAHLGLHYLNLAEADLRAALAQQPTGAAAHCLLGQVLEEKGQNEPVDEWEACLRYYVPGSDPVEAEWLSHAREHLKQEGKTS